MRISKNEVQLILPSTSISGANSLSSIEINWRGGHGLIYIQGTKSGDAVVDINCTIEDVSGGGNHVLRHFGASDTLETTFDFWRPRGKLSVSGGGSGGGDSITSLIVTVISLSKA